MLSEKIATLKVLAIGFACAVAANIPFYAWIFGKNWDWATGFPLGWIGGGMVYMATFFHEIGHTVFMWFYGYPTVPIFDFKYGGGFAVALTGQQILIAAMAWGALVYGIWALRGYRALQICLGLALILNLALVFNDYHTALIDFMGPAFECLVAGFLLYRAVFNLAARGSFERFLNAFFGFGMIFQVFVNAHGLLKNEAYRLVYYQQKGAHGFGDFDKIADRIGFLDFQGVVLLWVLLGAVCLIAPFFLYAIDRKTP